MSKILIIEDDVNILYSLCAKLGVIGHEAIADDGSGDIKDVWMKVNREKPDQIILDLIMPGFDAFELLKRIRSEAALAHIPVFVFTDMSDADTKSRCSDLGTDLFFIKTDFDIDGFVDKIKVMVRNMERNK